MKNNQEDGRMENYVIKLSDNPEGIVISSHNLKHLFQELQNFMSKNCYYEDNIISIEKMEKNNG